MLVRAGRKPPTSYSEEVLVWQTVNTRHALATPRILRLFAGSLPRQTKRAYSYTFILGVSMSSHLPLAPHIAHAANLFCLHTPLAVLSPAQGATLERREGAQRRKGRKMSTTIAAARDIPPLLSVVAEQTPPMRLRTAAARLARMPSQRKNVPHLSFSTFLSEYGLSTPIAMASPSSAWLIEGHAPWEHHPSEFGWTSVPWQLFWAEPLPLSLQHFHHLPLPTPPSASSHHFTALSPLPSTLPLPFLPYLFPPNPHLLLNRLSLPWHFLPSPPSSPVASLDASGLSHPILNSHGRISDEEKIFSATC